MFIYMLTIIIKLCSFYDNIIDIYFDSLWYFFASKSI